jgi:predicted ATP-binding protein involved in virulence
MYIESLQAENFRRFPDVQIDLQRGFNLLIGDNQSGKTAVLDALCIGLSCFFQGFRTGVSLGIERTDVRLAMHQLGDVVQMPAQYPVRIQCTGEVAGKRLRWERTLKDARSRTGRALTPLGELGAKLDRRMQKGEVFDLPVIAYFGTERVSRQRRTRPDASGRIKDRSLGYKDCLERDSNLRLIRSWIEQQTQAEAQKAQRRLPMSAAGQLQAIERAVCHCLPEVKQFFFDFEYKTLAVVFADKRRLPWPMLSDGVRSLATMAMDIAWRAAVLNPHRGADAPALASGVVLIDELDLALHPNWQRRVVADLRHAFPQLQFIATTHSPQVIASAAEAHVQRLEGGQATEVPHVYGMDTNAVLTDVMGATTRPEDILQLIAAVNRCMDARDFAAARAALTKLVERVGQVDTEAVRLRARIDFLSRVEARQ